MDRTAIYSNKAEAYAKYRWDYAPEALQAILAVTGLSRDAVIADLGAGTGIFTHQLVGCAAEIIAVEPNREMLHEAEKQLAGFPGVRLVAASAEETTLPSHSVDLITVAQAIHWFQPGPARSEFLRILKPGGWLALLRNSTTCEDDFSRGINTISTAEYGVAETHSAPANHVPADFYYGHDRYTRRVFPFVVEQTWETFIGATCSASYMPDPGHPLFPKFEKAAKEIFERYSQNGKRILACETELLLGQPV